MIGLGILLGSLAAAWAIIRYERLLLNLLWRAQGKGRGSW